MTINEKLTAARLLVQIRAMFLYVGLSYAKYIEADSGSGVDTAGIDYKKNIYYNTEFLDSLDAEETAGLMAHEISHVLYMHHFRGKGFHQKLWNVVTDLKINAILKELGFKLPANGLIPYLSGNYYYYTIESPSKGNLRLNITENGAEKLYHLVYEHFKDDLDSLNQSEDDEGNGDGGDDEVEGSSGNGENKDNNGLSRNYGIASGMDNHIPADSDMSEEEMSHAIRDIKRITNLGIQIQRSQKHGSLPGSLSSEVKELMKEKVDWRSALYNYVVNTLPHDYTWNRPSKRSIALGTYLPSVERESIDIVVDIDSSGSIDDKTLQQFVSECYGMFQAFQNMNMTLLISDTDIKQVYNLNNFEGANPLGKAIKIPGRGGTDHNCVASWVEKNKPDAKVVVCLTDGWTSFPPENQITADWLWILTKNNCGEDRIPYGKTITIED